MKRSELIAALQEIEPTDVDFDVYVASDEEGNRVTRLAAVQLEYYERDMSSTLYTIDLVADEDVGSEYDEEDVDEAIVLWP